MRRRNWLSFERMQARAQAQLPCDPEDRSLQTKVLEFGYLVSDTESHMDVLVAEEARGCQISG
jgi:hypothetical protein